MFLSMILVFRDYSLMLQCKDYCANCDEYSAKKIFILQCLYEKKKFIIIKPQPLLDEPLFTKFLTTGC